MLIPFRGILRLFVDFLRVHPSLNMFGQKSDRQAYGVLILDFDVDAAISRSAFRRIIGRLTDGTCRKTRRRAGLDSSPCSSK